MGGEAFAGADESADLGDVHAGLGGEVIGDGGEGGGDVGPTVEVEEGGGEDGGDEEEQGRVAVAVGEGAPKRRHQALGLHWRRDNVS